MTGPARSRRGKYESVCHLRARVCDCDNGACASVGISARTLGVGASWPGCWPCAGGCCDGSMPSRWEWPFALCDGGVRCVMAMRVCLVSGHCGAMVDAWWVVAKARRNTVQTANHDDRRPTTIILKILRVQRPVQPLNSPRYWAASALTGFEQGRCSQGLARELPAN